MKDSTKIAVALIVALTLIGLALIVNKKEEGHTGIDAVKKEMFVEKKDMVNLFEENDLRADFIEGCTEDNTSGYTECACLHDEIVGDIGFNGLVNLSLKYVSSEELNDKEAQAIVDAGYSCI
jgi:hypothetical protein